MSDHRTVAIDFDGTCCEYAFPDCGAPIVPVVETLRELKQRGWRIIIHTCRVNSHWPPGERIAKTSEMIEWLYNYEVPFDQIWGLVMRPCEGKRDLAIAKASGWEVVPHKDGAVMWHIGGPSGKPVAHVYLDDRGYAVRWKACGARRLVDTCEIIGAQSDAQWNDGKGPEGRSEL